MATQRTRIYLEGIELDLDRNVDIDFTYSIADISDFEKRTTTFSKTVSIPGTAHNNFILGNYFDFNIQNDYSSMLDNSGVNFNPLKKAFVKVTIDNVEVFAGVLRLLEIKSINSELIYECALFGSLGGLFSQLGDKLLTELDLSDLNHTYNITNIINSWSAPDISAVGYVYPSANYGIGVDANETQYDVKNFRPAVSVKRLFSEIISQAGYTYNDEIWDQNNLDKLILQNGEEVFSAFYDNLASVSLAETTTSSYLVFDSSTTNGLTVDTTTGTNDFVKNNTGSTLNLSLNFDIDYINSMPIFTSCGITVQVRNGATVKSVASDFIAFGSGTTTNGTLNYKRDIVLENGDLVEFYFFYQDILGGGSGSGFTILTTSSISFDTVTSGSKVPAIYNTVILGKSIVPEGIRQSDFVKSIINLLNLYIIQDPDNELNLQFIPHPEFYTSEVIDWTDKKDIAKGFSIKPSTEFIPRSYLFKYKDDNDYYSKIYKNKYAQNYGDLKYLTENEFVKDDKSTEFVFSLAPIVNTGNGNRLMAQIYDINPDGSYKQVKCNPKLSFWGGIITGTASYSIKNNSTVLYTTSNYGYAGHIYSPFIQSDGRLWDLVFTPPQEIYFNIGSYPTVNLYYLFYKKFVDSQNNKDSKLVTLYLLLNSVDILNLNFRKLIRIENGLYYLNKIDGYNPLSNDLTKVELLRIVALEDLDVYVQYTPSPVEGFSSYPRVTINKMLPFNKSFDVQWQFSQPTSPSPTITSGTQTITITSGQTSANGTPVVTPGNDGTFDFIRILPPSEDDGYIYQYTGDYTTF